MEKIYKDIWDQYTTQYGSKTSVFLQVGSFYEFYDLQDPRTGEAKMNVKEIVDFLGIQLTIKKSQGPIINMDGTPRWDGSKMDINKIIFRENKTPVHYDVLFAGFPDYVLHKWAGKLTAAGWTVIVVNQYKDRSGKVSERKVARILTPATHIEALSGSDAPIVAALWIVPCAGAQAPSFGAATFDLSTGSTYTTSGQMRGTAEAYSSDELLHFLSVFAPRELLVFWRSADSRSVPSEEILRKQFDYGRSNNVMHVRWASDQGNFELPEAREQYLRRLFDPKTMLPLRQYLSLDDEKKERALCALLRFVEDYQPTSFEQLQQTISWTPDNLLLMGNHALSQLQILAPQGQQGVLDLFKNTAITPFGKRALKNRLLMPSAQSEEIEARLKEIDVMMALPEEQKKSLVASLRVIYDIPRLHRKMLCAEVREAEIVALHSSYTGADAIFRCLDRNLGLSAKFLEPLCRLFDVERASNPSENRSFLPVALHPKIAALEQQLASEEESLDNFLRILRRLASSETGIRKEDGEKVPYKITGTRTALGVLGGAKTTGAGLKTLEELPEDQRKFSISLKASCGIIESEYLDQLNARILSLRQRLQVQVSLALPDVCAEFCAAIGSDSCRLENEIVAIDCSLGLAKEAAERNWCRPRISSNPVQSGVRAEGLRHPLIEGLLHKTKYVSHNVHLGAGAPANGWLVYGMNASGKSSLMKSLGIAVHLAQAGCYVPATAFELVPYRSLFTRILNQDNLWAGLSSFAVEMSEMRDILRAANKKTLILGDELCSGTESDSATALVAAGIEWFSEAGASYIFATHLHGLTGVLPPPESIGLKIWHLKVATDPYTGKLIYHRNLEPGSGSSLYGLEVARAMDVPVAFLDKAHKIRRRLLGTAADEDAPRSSWNSSVVRRACELCGCPTVRELEAHHIVPRAAGGSNHASNLMVLCEACHDKHHAAEESSVASVTLTETSEGLERLVVAAEVAEAGTNPKKIKAGQYSEEEVAKIRSMLLKYPKLAIKLIVFRLKHEEGLDVPEATIRKMRKEL